MTGDVAELVDLKASIAARLPLALGIVGLATMVLLFLMTGSVVVALKAVVMNVLSLGATFGVLVWVFQDGHLSGLLGFDAVGALDATMPLVVFLFAFGLSMDYEVFLLARIKEAWDETGDNDLAIAVGLDRTGRIITSAAALLVIVFAGFAAGELVLDQAARRRDGRRRDHRRDDRAHAARAGDDDPDGPLELVVAGPVAPPPRPLRRRRDVRDTDSRSCSALRNRPVRADPERGGVRPAAWRRRRRTARRRSRSTSARPRRRGRRP